MNKQQLLIKINKYVPDEDMPAVRELIDQYTYEYAERVIGQSVPNDGGEVIHDVHGNVKGHIAGSYWESCRRELREEQHKRNRELSSHKEDKGTE